MTPFEIVFDRIGGTKGQFLLRSSDGSTALRQFRKTLGDALIKRRLRRWVEPAFTPHITLSYDFSSNGTVEAAFSGLSWVRKGRP